MWPRFVDLSKDECRGALRNLDYKAHSAVIEALRAHGPLTEEDKKLLEMICRKFGIPLHVHKGEVRRVINNDRLNTIAESLFGPNTDIEWTMYGRRNLPQVPRLAPESIFSEIANSSASEEVVRNAELPPSAQTGSGETIRGIETMSRKRKDFGTSLFSSKVYVMDSDCTPPPCPNKNSIVTQEASNVPTLSVDCASPEVRSQDSAPLIDLTSPTKSSVASTSQSVSTLKPADVDPNPSSFSGFEQLTASWWNNQERNPPPDVEMVSIEEQASTISDSNKPSCDGKSSQRSLASLCTTKSLIMNPPSVSSSPVCSPSSSKDHLSTLPCAPPSNKFLSQVRNKSPRPISPSLGLKLSPMSPSSSKPPLKSKTDGIFQKKSPNVFPTNTVLTSPENSQSNSSPSSGNDPSKTAESTTSAFKPSAKSIPNAGLNLQLASQRTTFPNSTAKPPGAKNLSPVIFNVTSSTSSSEVNSSAKTTMAVQGDTVRTLQPRLATKSGIGASVKIGTTNASAFPYRNDGGIMRSARIVNISPGNRLPCALPTSAISALGLAGNVGPTALRVTYPQGTLNSPPIRVSAAAKPNVIVVHKAQMWPRAQQAGAVLVGSSPVVKVPNNDVAQETVSTPPPKQDKINKPSGLKSSAKAAVRPPHPPPSATDKVPGSRSLSSTSRTESTSSEANNSKPSENTNDAQCKKSLLADIMEASGILLENAARNKALKEKSNSVKNNQDHNDSYEEIEVISISDNRHETTSSRLSESNKSGKDSDGYNSSGKTALKVKLVERNGVVTEKQSATQAQLLESQSKNSCNSVVSSSHIANENVKSSSDCSTREQLVTLNEDS